MCKVSNVTEKRNESNQFKQSKRKERGKKNHSISGTKRKVYMMEYRVKPYMRL